VAASYIFTSACFQSSFCSNESPVRSYGAQNNVCSDVSKERAASNYGVTKLRSGGRWSNRGEEMGHYKGSLHRDNYEKGEG
jgi:hypothetical protein